MTTTDHVAEEFPGDPLVIGCMSCLAEPGEPCFVLPYGRADLVHVARWHAFWASQGARAARERVRTTRRDHG